MHSSGLLFICLSIVLDFKTNSLTIVPLYLVYVGIDEILKYSSKQLLIFVYIYIYVFKSLAFSSFVSIKQLYIIV